MPLRDRLQTETDLRLKWSLQRLARRAQRQLDQTPLLQRQSRALTRRWQSVPAGVRAVAFPMAVFAVAVAGLFLPIPVHWRALSHPKQAADFVGQAWTVTAGSVGFALVLIVFAFQTIATARPTVSVGELAPVGPLLLVLYLGVAALIVDGLVLLDVGHQAPAAWAATWATDLSGAAIASLAFLIALSLRAVDPQILRQRRIANVKRRAELAITSEAVQRLALSILMEDAKKYGYDISPLESTGPPRRDAQSVHPQASGVVLDLRLGRLRRAAHGRTDSSGPTVVVTAVPGRAVTPEARLAFVPPNATDRQAQLTRSAFRVRRRPGADAGSLLVGAADELHHEAMQSIEDGRAAAFEDAIHAQQELILAFPEAWGRLGQTFSGELASGMFPLARGPLDPVGQHLYEQALKATEHGEREIAFDAVGVLLAVASRAPELSAHGLSDRMLGVLSSIAAATGNAPPASLKRIIHEQTLGHVTSYIDYVVLPRIENVENAAADRLDAVMFLCEALRVLADMIKTATEQGDRSFFDEATKRWRGFGQYWLMEHEYPTGDPDAEHDLAKSVGNCLDRFRFVMCAWQVRLLWGEPNNESALHALTTLAWSSDVAQLFSLAELPYGDPAARLLSDWVLWGLPSGEAHMIDTTTPVLRTLVLLAMRLRPSATLALEPTQWLLDNSGRIDAAITEVEGASALLAATGVVDASTSAAVLREAVRRAAAGQAARLEEQLIVAALDPARVDLLTRLIRERWEERRLVADLFRAAGSFEETAADNPAAAFGYRHYEPKDWYVDDRVGGMEGHAAQVAHGIVQGENASLWDALQRSRPLRRTPGDVNQRLAAAIATMQQGGYSPSVVFVSRRAWRLRQSLELEPSDRERGAEVRVLGLSHGLKVVEAFDLPGDRVILADLAAFARFRQWRPGSHPLAVTVRGFNEAEALAAVREDAQLMREKGRTRQADRARELRKQVFVEILEQFRLEIAEADAARAVLLPREIARD